MVPLVARQGNLEPLVLHSGGASGRSPRLHRAVGAGRVSPKATLLLPRNGVRTARQVLDKSGSDPGPVLGSSQVKYLSDDASRRKFSSRYTKTSRPDGGAAEGAGDATGSQGKGGGRNEGKGGGGATTSSKAAAGPSVAVGMAAVLGHDYAANVDVERERAAAAAADDEDGGGSVVHSMDGGAGEGGGLGRVESLRPGDLEGAVTQDDLARHIDRNDAKAGHLLAR